MANDEWDDFDRAEIDAQKRIISEEDKGEWEAERRQFLDPTRREMLLFLGRQWKSLCPESWRDDAEVAIYWYANHYHGGQFTNLYAALSASEFRPGPFSNLWEDGELGTVTDMYRDLEDKFGKERDI